MRPADPAIRWSRAARQQPVDEVLNWPSTHNMSRLRLRRITLCSGLIAEQRLRQRAVKVEGLRWLSLQVLARPGFATRTWGLPFLTVLCRSERANAKRRRRHQTVPEKAAWGMRLIARWLPHRRLVMVGDGAFASLEL